MTKTKVSKYLFHLTVHNTFFKDDTGFLFYPNPTPIFRLHYHTLLSFMVAWVPCASSKIRVAQRSILN